MKRFAIVVAVLLCGITARAQLTTVTASSVKIGGVPIASGTVTFTPVNQQRQPIPFVTGGGGLNAPKAFKCQIAAGAITGTCQVPDAAQTVPANILYSVEITDSATQSAFVMVVPGITGATWPLDQYAPPANTTSVQPLQISYGTAAPTGSCVSPSLYVRNASGGQLYICVGGSWVVVGGGNAVSGTFITSAAPTQIIAYGDSITAGSWATPFPNYWAQRLGIATTSLFNYGVSGAQSSWLGYGATGSTASAVLNSDSPTLAATQPLRTFMIGTNDLVAHGSGAYEAIFNQLTSAIATWETVPITSKVTGGSVVTGATFTGTCANDTTALQVTGINCTSNGATATFTITTYGKPIYIWYRSIQGDFGTFTYKVDGGSATSVTNYFGFDVNAGVSNALGWIRIPNVAAGSHTVVFTKTSANGVMPIVAVGTPSNAPANAQPYLIWGEVPNQYNGANAAAVAAYVADVDANQALLFNDGLSVYLAPVSKFLQMTTAGADYATTVTIASSTGGSGYTGTGTATGTGGTCSVQPQANVGNTGGVLSFTLSVNGVCTAPPTGFSLSGPTGGSGASITWYFAGQLHPNTQGNYELLSAFEQSLRPIPPTAPLYSLSSVPNADSSFSTIVGAGPTGTINPGLNISSLNGYSVGTSWIDNFYTIYEANNYYGWRFCTYPGGTPLSSTGSLTCVFQYTPQTGIHLAPKTFSALNACNSGNEGSSSPVTDSTTNVWGATVTGGGANHILAYCDGTNWTVAAK